MQQKEKKEVESGKEPSNPGHQKLSDTIEDAHAAGDGALERGKDSLIASDDDGAGAPPSTTGGEAY